MQQVGSAARDIMPVSIGSLESEALRDAAIAAVGAVTAITFKVAFDTGGWEQVEGYHCAGAGVIADPINGGALLVMSNCPTHTHLANHYAKGDYEGAP